MMGAAAIALSFAPMAKAGTIVGDNNIDNCIPFSCASEFGVTTYQQVYSSTAFASPISFNNINFFKKIGGLMNSATYKVSFSTTSKPVLGLDSNFLSNIGADNKEFGTFNISGEMPNVLNLAGSIFNYNPALGNLLMTVNVIDTTTPAFSSFFQADSTGLVTSRLFGGDFGMNDSFGLVTEFTSTDVPPTAVPTPALLPGLIGIGVAALRKRKNERLEVAEVAEV